MTHRLFKHVINNNEQNIKEWLHTDDMVIDDLGFRDAVHVMTELEQQVKIPAFFRGKKQFSTEEANRTRSSITKNRWVIESDMLQHFFLYTMRKLFRKWEYQKMELFQLSS